nr:hypothetical protein MFLOJ_25750 [Mycobacterium florentinum]
MRPEARYVVYLHCRANLTALVDAPVDRGAPGGDLDGHLEDSRLDRFDRFAVALGPQAFGAIVRPDAQMQHRGSTVANSDSVPAPFDNNAPQ